VHKYVATFRALYEAEDDLTAQVIADQIRVNGSLDLDEDDGDTFECTQVTGNHLELEPTELRIQMGKLRNILIKTRSRRGLDLAKEIDQFIHALRFRDSGEFTAGGYSHGDFMDLCINILEKGEEPDVSE